MTTEWRRRICLKFSRSIRPGGCPVRSTPWDVRVHGDGEEEAPPPEAAAPALPAPVAAVTAVPAASTPAAPPAVVSTVPPEPGVAPGSPSKSHCIFTGLLQQVPG